MTTLLPSKARPISNIATEPSNSKVGKCYHPDKRIEYLYLKAEIDLLWQKLNTLKQQKQDLETQLSAQSQK